MATELLLSAMSYPQGRKDGKGASVWFSREDEPPTQIATIQNIKSRVSGRRSRAGTVPRRELFVLRKKNGEQLASVHLFVLSNLALPHSYLPFTLFHRAVNILRHMEDTE